MHQQILQSATAARRLELEKLGRIRKEIDLNEHSERHKNVTRTI
ncbi:hypothetical protein [Epibacterium ulvae]